MCVIYVSHTTQCLLCHDSIRHLFSLVAVMYLSLSQMRAVSALLV